MSTQKKIVNSSVTSFEKPLVTVDIVVFAVLSGKLNVLLVQRNVDMSEPYPNQWALPGGFIDIHVDKTLHDCALRKLRKKTGVKNAYLEQLGSWGGCSRDPRGWSTTHAYFSLIPADLAANIQAGGNAVKVMWSSIAGAHVKEKLAFDHNVIVSAAIERLRNKVEYTSLPAFLVPKEFTLSELQKTYEIVLGRKLDKSAFRTRMLTAELVQALPRFRTGINRPAQLYMLRSSMKPVIFQRPFQSSGVTKN
jgi:8-oxo-dGTP diphosphatase